MNSNYICDPRLQELTERRDRLIEAKRIKELEKEISELEKELGYGQKGPNISLEEYKNQSLNKLKETSEAYFGKVENCKCRKCSTKPSSDFFREAVNKVRCHHLNQREDESFFDSEGNQCVCADDVSCSECPANCYCG